MGGRRREKRTGRDLKISMNEFIGGKLGRAVGYCWVG